MQTYHLMEQTKSVVHVHFKYTQINVTFYTDISIALVQSMCKLYQCRLVKYEGKDLVKQSITICNVEIAQAYRIIVDLTQTK